MDNIKINRLNPDTFEYQTYNAVDENLIAQSELDTAFTASTDYIEYYVYDQNQSLIFPSSTIPLTSYGVREGDIVLNPAQNLSSSGFDIGTYNIYYSFYRKRLSSNNVEKYFISEISSDRTEIRLDSNEIENINIISSSNEFIQYRENSEFFVDFYLNFGENQTVIANNIQLDAEEGIDPTVLVKLYDPLPNEFDLKSTLWIVELLSAPQLYEVNFPFEPIIEEDFTYIKGPNYSLNIVQQTGKPGQEFSYNTLINSNVTSSTNQIKSLLKEKDININIDYENFNNFIKFSSAKTRLENFYYKVGLIQSSSAEISASLGQVISQTTSSFSYSSSISTLTNQIENIIENFDGYEYFLYFNSGSLYSYPKTNTQPPFNLYPTGSTEVLTWLGNADPNNVYYGGQALSASNYDLNNRDYLYYSIPEYLRDDPQNINYELFVDMVGQYYDNTWVYAKDITNKFNADNRLDFGISKDLVADAIKEFAVKLYSNNFNTDDLYTAFLGLTPSGSTFPVTDITGSFPVTTTGYEFIDTEISASNDIVPLNDVNKSLYKRIYHNIPYLLKTKGTIAGIRALITAYGIPDTILRISEFGGKDKNEAQDYDLKQNVFNYAFDTGPSATNYVSSSLNINTKFNTAGQNPQTIQLRFKTAGIPTASSNVASSDIRYSQSLWFGNNEGGNLVLEYTGSGLISGSYSGSTINPYDYYGTLKWVPAQQDNPSISASAYLPFFDGGWWSAQINMPLEDSGAGLINLTASLSTANQINGKIGFSASDSTTGYDSTYYATAGKANLNDDSNYVFDDGTIYEPFSGSFQELRYWSGSLDEDVFFDYVVNPYSIEGNTINNTPDSLLFRADLGTQLDTASRTSIHPRVTGSAVQITQSFTNDSSYFIPNNRGLFVTNIEDIFQDQVVAGMKNRITEKVILKNNNLAESPYGRNTNSPDADGDILPTQGIVTASALSPMRSLQQFSYNSQSYTPNVNYLEVAFSPANQINDDINAQLGYFNIGDYIGDPRLISSSDTSYPSLDRLRDAYFEKYYASYDIRDFVRLIKFFDNSLFKMIKDFTPARTSLASGVVVKQHLLERNRQRPAQVSSSFENLSGSIKPFPKNYNTGSTDYPQYATSGSAIFKFSGGPGGVMNRYNGLQSYPSGSDGTGPNNQFFLTQSYNVTGTAREPYGYSIINGTYFNYSSSQFLSASYQGLGVSNVATQHEFYDGEFSGSNIVVTTQSLNPDCGPYLNVVDKGALYKPHFFNDNLTFITKNVSNPQFTNETIPNMGTVEAKVFNNPLNEPNPGDAWIFSETIKDPTIINTLGLPTQGTVSLYNYVTSIKLAKIDENGNDLSDYILGSNELQIVLPDASITGDTIVTYKIAGILIERNSIFIRTVVNQNSNIFDGNAVGGPYYPITSSNRGGSENWTFEISTTQTSSETARLQPDSRQQGVFLNNNTLNQTQIYYSYIKRTGPLDPTDSNFPNVTSSYTPISNGLEPSAEKGYYATWGDIIPGAENNLNAPTGQRNMWVNGTEGFGWDTNDQSLTTPTFVFAQRALREPRGIWNYDDGGDRVPTWAGNDWGQNTFYDTGAYILKRTPNVPLNFYATIAYSASDLTAGGGSFTLESDGTLLDNPTSFAYNKDATGNYNQGINFSSGSFTVDQAKEIFITTASYNTINDAAVVYDLSSVTPSTVENLPLDSFYKGYMLQSIGINIAPNTTVYIDDRFKNPIELVGNLNVGNKYFIFYTSSADTYDPTSPTYGLVGLHTAVGIGKVSGNNQSFTNYYSNLPTFGAAASNLSLGDSVTAANLGNRQSVLFKPATSAESVSDTIFDDITNTLIPGSSGSRKYNNVKTWEPDGVDISNAGIPRAASNFTSSLNYNFGAVKFAGTFNPPTLLSGEFDIFKPLTGSDFTGNVDFNASTDISRNIYWDQNNLTTDGSYIFNSSNFSNWQALTQTLVSPLPASTNFIVVDELDSYVEYNGVLIFGQNRLPDDTEVGVEFKDNNGNKQVSAKITPIGGLIQINNAQWNGSNIDFTDYYVFFASRAQTLIRTSDSGFNFGTDEFSLRLVIKCNEEVYYAFSEWDVSRVQWGGSYLNQAGGISLYSLNRTSGNPTITSTGVGNYLTNGGTFNQHEAVPSAFTGSLFAQAFLKYTGSINDGTDAGLVVDTVLTASSIITGSALEGYTFDFVSTASNATGTHYNPVTYDASNLATTSSTLALNGGVYYIEYSMSGFSSSVAVNANLEFDNALNGFPGAVNGKIIIGTTSSTESTVVTDPSASITPQIFYGNRQNIDLAGGNNTPLSVLGNPITFDNNFQSSENSIEFNQLPFNQSITILTSSVGTFTVSGSFYNAGEGFSLDDTFRFGINVNKEAGNIGVVITSASWGFSPGYSYYTQNFSPYLATQSYANNPLAVESASFNFFQPPTSSEFSIPTFFGNGVQPFAYALDCQPLLGNYNLQRKSTYIMDVDYNNTSGPIIPVNQQQILEGTAVKAAVPDSNYSSQTWTIPRYTGSRSICKSYNIYSYGDIGTYGQLPNIEVRFAYFAYFGSIINPYPLYNGVSQLNVTYLIDEQSNALPPSLSGLSYEIMGQLYPINSTVQLSVNSSSNNLENLNGYQTVANVGSTFEPVCYTQNAGDSYSTSIPLSGSGRISIYDNTGNPAARTVYATSVMGQGTNLSDADQYRQTTSIPFIKLTPGYANTSFEIRSGSNNDAAESSNRFSPYGNPNGTPAQPGIANSGPDVGFIFTSSLDLSKASIGGDVSNDLKNPQKLYIETSFLTTFLYESGTDEMQTRHRLVLIRDGVTQNIPFELDEFSLEVKYLGRLVNCGSVLGSIEQGGGWRNGTMLQFITGNPNNSYKSGDPNSIAAGNFGLTNDNTMRVLYENPPYKSLLLNRGINWKKHGGNVNGGPVEFSKWNIKLNSGDFIFKAGDQVYLEFRGQMHSTNSRNIFYPPAAENETFLPVNYTVIGANDTADGDNEASSPFWEFSASRQDVLMMSSSNFNEAYGKAWSQGNLVYTPSATQYYESGREPLGTKFPSIKVPLEIKQNDQIRFVNNETYTYNIKEVIPPQENIVPSLAGNDVGKVKIVLDGNIPSGSSVNLDFFVIRRPSDNAGAVYLDVDQNQDIGPKRFSQTGSEFSSGGVLMSSYPSEGIAISSSQIVNNLISKGVIQS